MVSFSSITSAALWCFTVQLELLRADWPAELLSSDEGKEIYGESAMFTQTACGDNAEFCVAFRIQARMARSSTEVCLCEWAYIGDLRSVNKILSIIAWTILVRLSTELLESRVLQRADRSLPAQMQSNCSEPS